MNETPPAETPETPTESPKQMLAWPGAKPGHKIRPTEKTKRALIEIIERKRCSKAVDYKGVALAHGINGDALKGLYWKWRNGLVELGEPTTPDEIELDARLALIDKRSAVLRYQRLLLGTFQGLLSKAEEAAGKGNALAFDELGIPKVLAQMDRAEDMRGKAEKTLLNILETLQAQKASEDAKHQIPEVPSKVIGGAVPAARAEMQQQIEQAVESGKFADNGHGEN